MSLLWRQKKTSSAFTSQKMRTHVTIVFAWSESTVWYLYCAYTTVKQLRLVLLVSRGGVLEDVLGLEDTFWSPWPWPRSLKSSKIALSSAPGQHHFWTVEISLENARNLAKNLQRPFFWFPQMEIAWKKFFEDLFCLKKIFEDLF